MATARSREPRVKAKGVDPRNRLNDLDSQRWLPFQKSWFVISSADPTNKTATEFVQFFTKRRIEGQGPSRVGLIKKNEAALAPVVEKLGRTAIVFDAAYSVDRPSGENLNLDYLLIDLRDEFTEVAAYLDTEEEWIALLHHLCQHLKPSAYATIFVRNLDAHGQLMPIAWQLGFRIARFMTIKDEKIGCETAPTSLEKTAPDPVSSTRLSSRFGKTTEAAVLHAVPGIGNNEKANDRTATAALWCSRQDVFYCLNFRKEAVASRESQWLDTRLSCSPVARLASHAPAPTGNSSLAFAKRPRSSWFVLKPPPREKGVLLHPAKFPESLVEAFVKEFTKEGERIFDPMAGTGSTLLSALACHREAYGIELNQNFHRIAVDRIRKFLPALPGLMASPAWNLVCGDASSAQSYRTLPEEFDYILTSPPYWDMLRMKGAETQQQRKKAGLLQYYSEDERDLGNIADYESFLASLVDIYKVVASRLAAGRYMTVVVKNVKKRGRIYPLAWDLALRLSEDLVLCHEQFWCQDDQKIAPFGYRYAWVSNTFHHYCLHFRKRERLNVPPHKTSRSQTS